MVIFWYMMGARNLGSAILMAEKSHRDTKKSYAKVLSIIKRRTLSVIAKQNVQKRTKSSPKIVEKRGTTNESIATGVAKGGQQDPSATT